MHSGSLHSSVLRLLVASRTVLHTQHSINCTAVLVKSSRKGTQCGHTYEMSREPASVLETILLDSKSLLFHTVLKTSNLLPSTSFLGRTHLRMLITHAARLLSSSASSRTTASAACASNFFAVTPCWKVLITSNAIPCKPRLISVVPLVFRWYCFQRCVGTVCFAFFRLEEALLAQVHGAPLVHVIGLHRAEPKVLCTYTLVRSTSTASATAKKPVHVHCSGSRSLTRTLFW